jgi:predicted nucleic acid-binding protein
MSAYLIDTNGLIYHYQGDPLGRAIGEILRHSGNRVYATDLSHVEIRSALASMVRDARLPAADYRIVMRQFLYDVSSLGRLHVHPLRRRFVDPCVRLIEDYAVRQGCGLDTLDCLHLLAALDLKQREPDLYFVTADRALANVAGLAGVPPLLLEQVAQAAAPLTE